MEITAKEIEKQLPSNTDAPLDEETAPVVTPENIDTADSLHSNEPVHGIRARVVLDTFTGGSGSVNPTGLPPGVIEVSQ